jgi:hypothetical protein
MNHGEALAGVHTLTCLQSVPEFLYLQSHVSEQTLGPPSTVMYNLWETSMNILRSHLEKNLNRIYERSAR